MIDNPSKDLLAEKGEERIYAKITGHDEEAHFLKDMEIQDMLEDAQIEDPELYELLIMSQITVTERNKHDLSQFCYFNEEGKAAYTALIHFKSHRHRAIIESEEEKIREDRHFNEDEGFYDQIKKKQTQKEANMNKH